MLVTAALTLQLAAAQPVAPREFVETLDGPPTRVAVLGTPHLTTIDGLDTAWLEPLLARLVTWQPDLIMVENLPGRALEQMRADRAYTEVAAQFGGEALALAAQMQAHLAIDPAGARAAIETRLADGPQEPDERRRLAALFLAAADPVSAGVQWRRLTEAERVEDISLPAPAVTALNDTLTSVNESHAIGAALAARLGMERVYPIDSHADKDAFLALEEALTAAFRDSRVMAEVMSSDGMAQLQTYGGNVANGDDLLQRYREMNDAAYQRLDIRLQWASFARADMNGLGRQRLALWESRNLAMAANARKAMARHPHPRVLIVVGAAHKPFLEDLLARGMDVRIVDMAALLQPAPEAAAGGR